MNCLFAIYAPVVFSIVWSITKRRNESAEAFIIACVGFLVVANEIMKHIAIEYGNVSDWMILLQQAASSFIVPLAYMFFAREAGRDMLNETSVLLFALTGFLVFPDIVIYFGKDSVPLDVEYKMFCIVGEEVHKYTIADFVIVVQSLVTIMRVIPLYRTIRRYGLSVSDDVRTFMMWWCAAVAFIMFASYNNEIGVYNVFVDVLCHVVFMLLVTFAFYKLGKGFDLRPILKGEDSKEHVELDSFIETSAQIAKGIKRLVEDEKVFLNTGYSAENAISELGTNRTYFHKVVKMEYGCRFSELLNRERVKNVKNLLLNTNESLLMIAESSGFGSASYMSKIFKQLEGVSPREWQEKQYKTIVN